MSEPALRARYVQYVTEAETVVADCLRRRIRDPESAFTASLIAVVAIGTYRVTMFTHHPDEASELASHLRRLLATVGTGIGGTEAP
jgi:hypothetical protein